MAPFFLPFHSLKMWCLGVSTARPSYKRPSAKSRVYFFETEQEAQVKLKQIKIEFISDFDGSEDPRIETLNEDSSNELIEELVQTISDPDSF